MHRHPHFLIIFCMILFFAIRFPLLDWRLGSLPHATMAFQMRAPSMIMFVYLFSIRYQGNAGKNYLQ